MDAARTPIAAIDLSGCQASPLQAVDNGNHSLADYTQSRHQIDLVDTWIVSSDSQHRKLCRRYLIFAEGAKYVFKDRDLGS
jgi:pantothenate kinase